MSTKRLFLMVLMVVIGCQQTGVGAEKPPLPTNAEGVSAEAKPDDQLQLNKNTLLNDPNEELRVKAATVMLFSENPVARKILLETLEQIDNSAARMAVCKALIQTRSSNDSVKAKEDFVQPLLGILDTEIDAEAQLAAEATLIFEYEKIGQSLEETATDASKPVKTRLNAIKALKLRSDMMATIRLIRLVDDPEKQVAAGAKSALHSLGIQVDEDPETRKENIEKIRREGQVAFLRTQLIRQEAQMRQMRTELDLWQRRYLSELEQRYKGISDDTAKGEFLAKHLRDTEKVVRLWALDKAHKWRLAPGSKLPEGLGPILINLISDSNRDVRLRTAELLAFMPELNSAPRLLAQLEAEQDDQVETKLLVALGGACSYAISNSPAEISPEMKQIRRQTLEWAAKFLFEEKPEKAQNGAEVIKKLLERDGLNPEEVDKYLGYLSERYNQQRDKLDGTLRGGLLSAMAGLCAQDSTYKAKAASLFEPLFIEALRDEANFVRETAVDGLTYIDKTSALNTLRKDFVNDPSVILRKKLIALADAVGGKEDLNWLAEKIGSNSESDLAWQAMLKIFNGSDADVLDAWEDKLTSQSSKIRLSNGQKIDFLEIAEAKAVSEDKPKKREKLAKLHHETGQFEQAADYFGTLYEAAQTAEAKNAILPNLLDACLKSSRVERAAELVANCLSEGDLDPNNVVVQSIDNYFSKPPVGADPNAVLKALMRIKAPQGRPKWHQWLKNRAARLGKGKEPDKPTQLSN